MKDAKLMTDSELLDEFGFVSPCAVEDEAEYLDAAIELASEMMDRGYVGRLHGFMHWLGTRKQAA